MTKIISNDALAAQELVNLVGKHIVIGVPLGLGKPIGLLNALYQLACSDASIQLTILTGLTFSRPSYKNILEQRLVEPILARLLGDYADLLYEKPRELQQLPANINVIEFFLLPGKFLHNTYVQKNYISSCYTNVVRDVCQYPVNVLAQLVSAKDQYTDKYSISCNTDLFHDMYDQLKLAEAQGRKIAVVGEVNANLPYMYGEVAEIKQEAFSMVLDTQNYRALFAVPRDELSTQDHLIGIYSSSLIEDNGCLQIGIGALSNALANALIFRHQQNELYLSLLKALTQDKTLLPSSTGIFTQGLYASTEMLSDEYLQLYNAGILTKRVYDDIGLQQLLNSKLISENITPDILPILIENKIISENLTSTDVAFLKKFGILRNDIMLEKNTLILSTGDTFSADLSNLKNRTKIIEKCLGDKLKSGKIIHAGFFFGSVDLYNQLRQMPMDERQQIEMTSIARTNSLLSAPALLTLQRQNARFVNSSLMITLLGGAISDGLTDYQEVSGVGGQYDFVNMANQLADGRSIINCRSTRTTKNGTVSNILWDYSNSTLPRYLRDYIVTEYGIADCRSKTDGDVIKAILNITDSRFQQALLETARSAGKISRDYQIPTAYQHNYPENLDKVLHAQLLQGLFKPYPFGSDLTSEEEAIARALLFLKNQNSLKMSGLLLISLLHFRSDPTTDACLTRMQLNQYTNIQNFIYKKILRYVLRSQKLSQD